MSRYEPRCVRTVGIPEIHHKTHPHIGSYFYLLNPGTRMFVYEPGGKECYDTTNQRLVITATKGSPSPIKVVNEEFRTFEMQADDIQSVEAAVVAFWEECCGGDEKAFHCRVALKGF